MWWPQTVPYKERLKQWVKCCILLLSLQISRGCPFSSTVWPLGVGMKSSITAQGPEEFYICKLPVLGHICSDVCCCMERLHNQLDIDINIYTTDVNVCPAQLNLEIILWRHSSMCTWVLYFFPSVWSGCPYQWILVDLVLPTWASALCMFLSKEIFPIPILFTCVLPYHLLLCLYIN